MIHIDNLIMAIVITFITIVLSKICEDRCNQYTKYVLVACAIYSFIRIIKYIDAFSFVFEKYSLSWSLVLGLNLVVALLPTVIGIIGYKVMTQKKRITNELERMRIQEL